jgi:hypothetical protein
MEKMTNKDWLDLMRNKEDEIIEALETAYIQASYNHDEYFGGYGIESGVILDSDGAIRIVEETPNSTDGGVWAGEAIYIATIKDFSLWQNEDEEEWIRHELEERYGDFQRYTEEGSPTLDELKKYDPQAYRNILDDMAWRVESVDASDWAHESLMKVRLFLNEEM